MRAHTRAYAETLGVDPHVFSHSHPNPTPAVNKTRGTESSFNIADGGSDASSSSYSVRKGPKDADNASLHAALNFIMEQTKSGAVDRVSLSHRVRE